MEPTVRTMWMSVQLTMQCVVTKLVPSAPIQLVHTLVHVVLVTMTWMRIALVCIKCVCRNHFNKTETYIFCNASVLDLVLFCDDSVHLSFLIDHILVNGFYSVRFNSAVVCII